MKTISSDKSLVFWKQNANRANIFVNGGTDMRLFLKHNYLNVFSHLRDELTDKTKRYASVITLWHKTCDDECNIVRSEIKALLADKVEKIDEDIEKVVVKFRGNLGEIFTEAMFKANLFSELCAGISYEPIDPDNERFVDGNANSSVTGLPIGIQVKNYSIKNLVPKEVFNKALAEDMMRLRLDNLIPADKITDYLSAPHQMILSFTDAEDLFVSSNAAAIIFIGPKDIDGKKLQGDMKRKLPANWLFFDKICKEIENLK